MKRLTPKMREMLDAAQAAGFATSHFAPLSGESYWRAGGKRFPDVTGQALVRRRHLVLDPDRDTRRVTIPGIRGASGSRYLVAADAGGDR